MTGIGPARGVRVTIGLVVGILFAIPLVSTLLYTLRADDGGLTLDRWATVFSPAGAKLYSPIWIGLGNSLILAVVTVAIVLLVLAPTMILVHLRFGKLRPLFEFVVLLPLTIPAIVLVVGLTPVYLQIGRTLGTGAWTLAFAYGVTVLPFAYRSIQASIDAVDLRTLAEAARSLGAGWVTVVWHVLAPNLRPGLLAASLISVAVVLGEFTFASILNRQVFQTAMVVVGKSDAYAPAIFTLLALTAVFLLLIAIAVAGRARGRKLSS